MIYRNETKNAAVQPQIMKQLTKEATVNNRTFSVLGKTTKREFALFIICVLLFAVVANGQKAKCKKWTYDFSEVVKYLDTPQEACKAYVKEKYPNDNYKASVEATNDPESFRCSADETYIGIVYKRECASCCNVQLLEQNFQKKSDLQNGAISSLCLSPFSKMFG